MDLGKQSTTATHLDQHNSYYILTWILTPTEKRSLHPSAKKHLYSKWRPSEKRHNWPNPNGYIYTDNSASVTQGRESLKVLRARMPESLP